MSIYRRFMGLAVAYLGPDGIEYGVTFIGRNNSLRNPLR